MEKTIAVLLENGFEEIEAIVPIDILKRLNFNVILVGNEKMVTGGHGLKIEIDSLIDNLNIDKLDAIVLPGGMPGSTNLRDNPKVTDLVTKMYEAGKLTAAICAAPIALEKAGILKNKTCTGYPMPLVKETLAVGNYTGNRVEKDGNIITAKGPGASFEFAQTIAKALGKGSEVKMLFKNMFIK